MLVSFFKTVFRHVSFFLFGVVVFPQIAKLFGFLFQVYEELHVCVMERACWYRCRVPLQNTSSGCCCQSAGVAAGGGCGMSMAVWTLGPDGDDIDAVAKKGEGLVATKNIC